MNKLIKFSIGFLFISTIAGFVWLMFRGLDYLKDHLSSEATIDYAILFWVCLCFGLFTLGLFTLEEL